MQRHEYRLWVVVTELGSHEGAEDHMERFADAFEATHPEAGAVIAANHHLATLDATFSVEAEDAKAASEIGIDVFCDAANETGIPAQDIVEIRVERIVTTPEHDRNTGEFALAE